MCKPHLKLPMLTILKTPAGVNKKLPLIHSSTDSLAEIEYRCSEAPTSQIPLVGAVLCFFPPPSNSLFTGQSFLLTMDEARTENEPRVQRDITPLLVPCASLLYLHDRIPQCRHLSAKIQSEWTKVTPLAGPLPTPDYVVGLKRSAFTRDEIFQLQIYSAPNKATVFRDGLYFPFLVCEVSTDSSWHAYKLTISQR